MSVSLLVARLACCLGIALSPSVANPLGNHSSKHDFLPYEAIVGGQSADHCAPITEFLREGVRRAGLSLVSTGLMS